MNPLFKGINDIVDGIKSEVMLQNVDPRENRDIALKKSDDMKRKFERKNPQMRPSEEDFEKTVLENDIFGVLPLNKNRKWWPYYKKLGKLSL